ncbi:MAG: molybdate ABC transporter substrate-binding protein [Methanosarcinales archaeon]
MNSKTLFIGITVTGILTLAIFAIGCIQESTNSKTIVAFCGSASMPATKEAAKVFEEKTGIKVELHFSGSGTMLSQMKMSKRGDIYMPGTPDYMRMAERDGVVYPETVKIISYLVPAIGVQKGNPKNIQSLEDLTKLGIKVGIGNPKAVCLGLYAVELFEYNNLSDKIKPNIVTYAESCSKTAALISLSKVDAIIGWRVFGSWHPDQIKMVYLKPNQIPRLAYVPAAISTYTQDRESAQKFLDFTASGDI